MTSTDLRTGETLSIKPALITRDARGRVRSSLTPQALTARDRLVILRARQPWSPAKLLGAMWAIIAAALVVSA